MDGWVRDCGGNVGKMLAGWTMDDRPLNGLVYSPSSVVNCLAQALSRSDRHIFHTGHCAVCASRRVRRAGW